MRNFSDNLQMMSVNLLAELSLGSLYLEKLEY